MFPITTVPTDARDELEEIGSKAKFWYDRDVGNGSHERWLFKEPRRREGEDWSEKIAAELAELLRLPHATYELATWNDKEGVVTPRMERPGERLMLGSAIRTATTRTGA